MSILVAIALPNYKVAIIQSKEAVLREDLYRFRDLIDQYYADKGRYPESLETLVSAGYMRKLPVDPSGLENVFSAVALAARRYGGSVKRQLLLVVWTDESGDDILLLEPTIALCKKEKVVVSAIGPTAVLGAEEGSHSYVHPPNGQLYFLPVKKGPDAAFPERLRWPYWWSTSLPAWHNDIGTRARFEGWYGGRQRPPYHLSPSLTSHT